jgi:hypothetical protein
MQKKILISRRDTLVYSLLMTRFININTKKFFETNRWLKEYSRFDKRGLFVPNKIQEETIRLLEKISTLPYLAQNVIWNIGIKSLETCKTLHEKDICTIQIGNEVAIDDNDNEYIGLNIYDAIKLASELNVNEGEYLYSVYNQNKIKVL